MSSKSRRSFAKLNTQVRAACGPTQQGTGAAPVGIAAAGHDLKSPVSKSAVSKSAVSKDMADLYRQFLTEPSAERFFAVLRAFELPAHVAVPSLESLDQALAEGRFESIRTLVKHHARYFALSVRFHRLAAIAALELGDLEDAELERFTAQACLEGVLKSGDGSAERPYLIAHRADAQDVLTKLKLKPSRQKCVQTEQAVCDVFEVKTAKSQEQVWFTLYGAAQAPVATAKTPRKRAKKVTV